MAIIYCIRTLTHAYVASSRTEWDFTRSMRQLENGYFKPEHVQEHVKASDWHEVEVRASNVPSSFLAHEKARFREELKARGLVLLNKVDGKPAPERKKQRSRTYGV